MRGAATASGAAAAASCTKHPHAKIRAAPAGAGRTKQCAPGAGRGSPRPWESTAPPADGAAAAADGAMRALRREARKGRCYSLSGAVARVGLAEGRGLFLELLTSGRHVVLKLRLLAGPRVFGGESSRQGRQAAPSAYNGYARENQPRSEPSPGRRRPGAGPAPPGTCPPVHRRRARCCLLNMTALSRGRINARYPTSAPRTD